LADVGESSMATRLFDCNTGVNMRSRLKVFLALSSMTAIAGFSLSSIASAADPSIDAAPMQVKSKPIPDIPFFLVVDDRLTYSYTFNGTQPGTYSGGYNGVPASDKVDKQTYSFTHFDAWAYGTNALNIGVVKSNHTDPAAPCIVTDRVAASATSITALPTGDCAGATDVYANLRSTFGFNQIFNTKMFSFGPLHNVSLEIGGDVGAYNGYTASAKRAFVSGVQFAFELPYKGYFNVAPLLYKEYNHNSYTQCGALFVSGACNPDGNKEFNATWELETNWYMDLGFLPESMRYFAISGRANLIGPRGPEKGIGVPASVPTVIEYNTEPVRLTFDASKAAFGARYSHFVDVWVAYRYWQNKYGYDHSRSGECTVNFIPGGVNTGSCTESSVNAGVTVKF
jgi:hypothetical protein